LIDLEDQKPNENAKPVEQKSEKTGGNEDSGNKKTSRNYRYYRGRRRHYNKSGQQGGETKKSQFKKLSLVIPLFNEEESLNPLTNEIRKALKFLNISFEVIFVDDGSNDKSLQILKEICKTDKRFKFISFRKNYGKSAALQIGFNNATGDVLITMDADLQDDPNEIPNLIKKLEEGYDLVSGWKKVRHDPFIKKSSSRFFNYVTKVMSGIKIHDFNCGLKAYRKEVADNIKVYGELHRYMPVLADWQGFKVSEIPVKHHPRRYGKTKFGISRFFKGFIDLITVMFATRYIKRPMHFFGFFGALSFIIGLVVNGYLTVLWIIGEPLSNRPMLFLGMLLIIVGVQFFSVGLLGEMMVSSFLNEKEYIIKDKEI
jgi:glycosyltransferase involved in cell wall biosynthesis